MTFDTSKYVAAHGKAPRGYGNWAFIPAADYDKDNYTDFAMWHTGKFADAKKSAAAWFGPKGVHTVVVGS